VLRIRIRDRTKNKDPGAEKTYRFCNTVGEFKNLWKFYIKQFLIISELYVLIPHETLELIIIVSESVNTGGLAFTECFTVRFPAALSFNLCRLIRL
jgi:hypothetical protein